MHDQTIRRLVFYLCILLHHFCDGGSIFSTPSALPESIPVACCICLEEVKANNTAPAQYFDCNETMALTDPEYVYHFQRVCRKPCLDQLVQRHGSSPEGVVCPLCRSPLRIPQHLRSPRVNTPLHRPEDFQDIVWTDEAPTGTTTDAILTSEHFRPIRSTNDRAPQEPSRRFREQNPIDTTHTTYDDIVWTDELTPEEREHYNS